MEQLSYGAFSADLHQRQSGQRVPMQVSVEVTRRCPLECQHCFNNLPMGDQDARSREMTTVREHPVTEDSEHSDATEIYMYGTPWHGEAHFALAQRAPLQRIFVLEHGHGNILARLTPSQMVAELFARAFVPFHRHEYVDHALAFLERVADSVPCYHYCFEPDERPVEKILLFND